MSPSPPTPPLSDKEDSSISSQANTPPVIPPVLCFDRSPCIPPHMQYYYPYNWYMSPFQLYSTQTYFGPTTPPMMIPFWGSDCQPISNSSSIMGSSMALSYPLCVGSSVVDLPRGPPKKPPQSGYALWVGNLPKPTSIVELCRLFATTGLQSILLISKTNCAFVNYRSKSSLEQGLYVFESRGKAIRGQTLTIREQISSDQSQNQLVESVSLPTSSRQTNSDDRYFICKSLTIEDLDASVKQGIWATQSHNEEPFNSAFRNCKNVYLIFSVNKSGHFFGYARMESEIAHRQPCQDQPSEKEHSVSSMQGPRITQVPADPSIGLPRGRIVDDTPRSSIFWEATDTSSTSTNWTLPFRIRWLSPYGNSVPFSQTNHLFNAFNHGQPVKIARDGIEVDPVTGKILTDMLDQGL